VVEAGGVRLKAASKVGVGEGVVVGVSVCVGLIGSVGVAVTRLVGVGESVAVIAIVGDETSVGVCVGKAREVAVNMVFTVPSTSGVGKLGVYVAVGRAIPG
jgi:hypothetical protein